MADSEKICFCPLIGANERPREYAIISVTSPADFCTGEKNLAQGSHIEDVPSSIQESERIGTRPPESGFSIAFLIERGSEADLRESVTSEGLR